MEYCCFAGPAAAAVAVVAVAVAVDFVAASPETAVPA